SPPLSESLPCAGRRLASEPQSLRIVERPQANDCGARLAEDVDLESLAVARERGRYVSRGKTLGDAMAIGRRSNISNRRAVLQYRLVPDRLRVGVRQLEDD